MTNQEWIEIIKAEKKDICDYWALSEIASKYNLIFSSGATKYCLIDENSVIKWNKDASYISDIDKECENYQKALEKGIGFLFPKTEILYEEEDFRVIIQEKVDITYAGMEREAIKKLRHQCRTVSTVFVNKVQRNIYRDRTPNDWVKALVCIYGKQITRKFEEFTHEQKINDLHGNNVGFLNGKPVVLDFSGYHH